MLRILSLVLVGLALVQNILASGPFKPMDRVEPIEAIQAEFNASDEPHHENARVISSSLAVLLGPFAAHRLYLGTTPKVAVIYGVTFGGFGILALIDLFHLLFTKDLDVYRNSDQVFMWNTEKNKEPEPTVTPQ